MTRGLRLVAALGVIALASGCTHVPRDVPPTPEGRAGLLERFGKDQAALDALTAAQPELKKSYDWARAQCFVQHAYSERHENENTGFVDAALTQAETITSALQAKSAAPATQLINHAERMRPDLWAIAERHRGDRCAQATAGCLEVQLVRSGHESHTIGWRHATSYFAIAEDLARQAAREAEACAPPVPPPPPPPAAVVAPATVQRQTIALSADVLFAFDRYRAGEILSEGRRQLDDAAARLGAVDLIGVRVTGHTDPQGGDAYNDKLSQRRADTVKALLVERGVPAGKISTEGRGEREPVKACDTKALKGKALAACNQPNRRVVIDFSYLAKP